MFIVIFVTVLHLVHNVDFFARPAAAAGPSVTINELAWMGSSSSTADEWVELRNGTAEPIDLTGWRLTKVSGGIEVPMLTIPSGKNIPANGFFLIANYANTNPSSALNVIPDLVDTDVALNNSGLQVRLYDQNNLLHDTADDGSGAPLAGRNVSAEKVFWSMERNPVPGDGMTDDAWHTASRGVGFKDGKPEFGTPGSVNSNGAPIAVAGDDQSSVIGVAISFDGSESRDPENQALTLHWDFGDGATSADGAPQHVYAAAGEYVVTLTVSDGIDSAADSVAVVISTAPAAAPIGATPSPTTTTSPVKTGPVSACRGIQFSEVFPNPDGIDDGEFVEFYNPTTKPISLEGCVLWLNEKRKAVLGAVIVPAKKYAVIEKSVSKLSLTNTGGALKVLETSGAVVAEMQYPKAPEAESWSLIGKEWVWTNRVTSGKANLAPTDDEDDESVKRNVDEVPQPIGLADVQTMDIGTLVQIRGVVTVDPDRLGSRTIFLQSETGAVSVVLPAEAIKVAVGDELEVIGKVRMSLGRKRISADQNRLRILARGQSIVPKTITLDELSPELADMLVSVNGLISTASGAKFLIDDGTGEVDVYLKSSTGIVKPRSASGDRLVATGIVSVTTSGLRILPRTLDDLRVERVLGATTTAPSVKQLPTAPPNQNLWYWGLVGLGLLGAGVKPMIELWRKRKKRLEDQTA